MIGLKPGRVAEAPNPHGPGTIGPGEDSAGFENPVRFGKQPVLEVR